MKRIWVLPLALIALAACRAEDGTQPVSGSQAEPQTEIVVAGPERRVLALGDSLFAAYGLADEEGYPAQLERALREEGINARVIDAGFSGDTSAAAARRIAFTLEEQDQPLDLAVISLGGNDILRTLPPEETRTNLTAIVDALRAAEVPVLLLGLEAPANLGPDYAGAFDPIYTDLALREGVSLVPFWLGPVASRADLVQDDRIHPTAEGITVLVETTADDVAAALD